MNWKTIFKSFKNRDMQKRIFAVLAIIIVYRFLAHVPVPLAEPTRLKEIINSFINNNFGGFLNLLGGGVLSQMSIILVGLSPFITASVVMQLLTKAIPSLEEMHKDGETGRRKINQWTRMITVPLAIVQSIAFVYILRQTTIATHSTTLQAISLGDWVVAVGAMTAGSVLLMWLGELITEQGIGNGISLLIFAGIISQLPKTLSSIITSLFDTSAGGLSVFGWFVIPVNPTVFSIVLVLSLVSLLLLYFLVKVNEAQRIITINYAKRIHGNSTYGGVKSVLPLKLIAAGVVPVIFAVAILSLPAFIGQLLRATGGANYQSLADNLINWFQAPNMSKLVLSGVHIGDLVYPVSYFLLVIFFTYFYTGIVLNSSEIAEDLQKQGGFIESIRPGDQTEDYLSSIITRLNLFGSITLGFIAVMPFIAELIFAKIGINASNLAIGGTGLLIVVTVAIENLRQINSRALMVTYDEYK